MYHLPYNKDLKTFARQLENNSTLGEILLWQKLRAGNIQGYKFNRQKPIDNYIVDLYCKPLNLVIEIDGGYHYQQEQMLKDKQREEILQEKELNFLRFHDDEIRKDIDVVVRKIEEYMTAFEQEQKTNNK